MNFSIYLRRSAVMCFFTFLSLISPQSLLAHYNWIETNSEGEIGKKQTIMIFYGEYENSRKEEAGKRLEEANGIIAWVLTPSGKKINLELSKKNNHFYGEIIPSEPGRYEVLSINNEREVVDWRAHDLGIIRPVYYSRKVFFVHSKNEKNKVSSLNPVLDLDIIPVTSEGQNINHLKKNTPLKLDLYIKGNKVQKGKLMAFAPNGWMKELERGEDGLFTLIPLEKGQYLIEAIHTEKVPGSFKNKDYEAVRHRSILTLSVD